MSTVLVIDDELMVRNTLIRLLQREGYSTLGARSGRDAMAVLEHDTPDLILLDVMMPEMDGLGLLEILHADPRWKSIPVVMLTAVSDTHTVRRAEQLGAKQFLVKAAYSVAELLEQIRHYVERPNENART